jgi:hypothetical protein
MVDDGRESLEDEDPRALFEISVTPERVVRGQAVRVLWLLRNPHGEEAVAPVWFSVHSPQRVFEVRFDKNPPQRLRGGLWYVFSARRQPQPDVPAPEEPSSVPAGGILAYVTNPIYGLFRGRKAGEGLWKGYLTEHAGLVTLRARLEARANVVSAISQEHSVRILEPTGADVAALEAWRRMDLGAVLYTGPVLRVERLPRESQQVLEAFLQQHGKSVYADMVRTRLSIGRLAAGDFPAAYDLLLAFCGRGEPYLASYRSALLSWAHAGLGQVLDSEEAERRIEPPGVWPDLVGILRKARELRSRSRDRR